VNQASFKQRINNVAKGMLPYAIIAFLLGLAFEASPFRLSLNLTPSVPKGLYFYNKNDHSVKSHDEYIVFRHIPKPPYTKGNKYVPLEWLNYVKHPMGLPGDKILTEGNKNYRIENGKKIFLNKVYKGMPVYHKYDGSVIPEGKYFMGSSNPKGFDSRYFGLVNETQIIGKAYLLWEIKN